LLAGYWRYVIFIGVYAMPRDADDADIMPSCFKKAFRRQPDATP